MAIVTIGSMKARFNKVVITYAPINAKAPNKKPASGVFAVINFEININGNAKTKKVITLKAYISKTEPIDVFKIPFQLWAYKTTPSEADFQTDSVRPSLFLKKM